MKTPEANRFAACLIGQCVGDALGFIVEGQPPSVCGPYVEQVVKTGQVGECGRGRFLFGQYSDDSQLARDLMASILHCGKFSPEDYASRIATIFREERIVGRGIATDMAARRLNQGVPWEDAGEPAPSAGNGTAMRAAPVGLLFFDRPQEMIRVAHDQGRITHKDLRCSAGAVAIAGAVGLALQSEYIQASEFVAQLSDWARHFDPILADALLRMPGWLGQPWLMAAKEISTVGVSPGFRDAWQLISPFVTSSVLWSIYSFLRTPDDYLESICTAIIAGGDVDTTAAMTGAISGSWVGLDRIPHGLAQCVNDNGTWGYAELVELAQKYHSLAMQDRLQSR
jgi:ADP-ribosylglycohydrolase